MDLRSQKPRPWSPNSIMALSLDPAGKEYVGALSKIRFYLLQDGRNFASGRRPN